MENAAMALPKLDIENLSAEERLALIEQIWGSLSSGDVGLTPGQHDELVRRLEDVERNPADSVTWSEAQRRIREPKQ
jgi:putative addiction module component (TIGR02574 family)